ncbi:MAG: hypothetical protein HZC25_16220 [Rhodospirillales bacterium]|nr:hypothetical protein [Rhodospirillales bacterium]
MSERRRFWLFALAGFLILLALPASVRNLHFVIDDWEFLQLPFFNSTTHAIIGAIYRKLRVGREIYMILEAKLFGMDRQAMMFVSVALHGLNAVLFGLCVRGALPGRPRLAIAATGLAIAFPPFLAMTYFAIDSTRLPLLFTFLAVLSLQAWASKGGQGRLAFAAAAYFIGLTFYENAIFFAVVLPVAALPVLTADTGALWSRRVILRFAAMTGSVALGGAAFLIYRYLIGFSDSGRTETASLPAPGYLLDSFQPLLGFLLQPLWDIRPDPAGLLAGLALSLALLAALWPAGRPAVSTPREVLFVALAGLALLIAGLLPYWLIHQDIHVAWTTEARVFSSAGYGVILLLALPAGFLGAGVIRKPLALATATVAFLWLAFGFGLRLDWEKAADRHCLLWKSLLEQAPFVTENTVFVIAGLRERNERAIVFGGSDSLLVLIRMLYKYPGAADRVYGFHLDEGLKILSAQTSSGRGQSQRAGVIPSDAILLVQRHGDRLDIVDRIDTLSPPPTMETSPASAIASNRSRIMTNLPGLPGIDERLARLSIHCPDAPR